MEIETFVHGAMCMAYSGRCFLSAFMTGRSANQGDCAHTCRWTYRLLEREHGDPGSEYALEEESRPGEYFRSMRATAMQQSSHRRICA
jgi:putative protease